MSVTDLADHKLQKAAKQLEARLMGYATAGVISDRVVYEIQRTVKSHREDCLSRGVKFPALTPLVLRRCAMIELVRSDVTAPELLRALVEIKQRRSDVTDADLREAAAESFPRLSAILRSAQVKARQPISAASVTA